MNEKTATEMRIRMNRHPLRQMRAESLAHAVFSAIEQYVDPRDTRHCIYAIAKLFTEKGVEVLTDLDRERYGLPPRDENGWTQQDIVVLESLRALAIIRPIEMMAPKMKSPNPPLVLERTPDKP
tara:strand:+ start:75 stop:446 length:372 start_codon:yes stop_codon:yes gene_type:complete